MAWFIGTLSIDPTSATLKKSASLRHLSRTSFVDGEIATIEVLAFECASRLPLQQNASHGTAANRKSAASKRGESERENQGSVTTLIGRGSDHLFLARLKRDHEATSLAASTPKTLFAFVLAPAIAHFKKMPFVQTYRDQPIQFVACNELSTAPAAPCVFRNVLPDHCFRSARNRVAGPRQVAIVALDRVWSFWDHPPAWPA